MKKIKLFQNKFRFKLYKFIIWIFISNLFFIHFFDNNNNQLTTNSLHKITISHSQSINAISESNSVNIHRRNQGHFRLFIIFSPNLNLFFFFFTILESTASRLLKANSHTVRLKAVWSNFNFFYFYFFYSCFQQLEDIHIRITWKIQCGLVIE